MRKFELQLFAEGEQTGAEDQAAAGEEKGVGQNPTDMIEENEAAGEEKTREELYAEFKAENKDLFDKEVQDIVKARVKNLKGYEKQAKEVQPILDLLSKKYGDAKDVQELYKNIQNDDSLYEKEAMEMGVSVESLKEIRQLQFENEQLKKAKEEAEENRVMDEKLSSWVQQADELKEMYPIQLEDEFENENFIRMLDVGIDVKTAYEAVHMSEITSGLLKVSASETAKKVAKNIAAKGKRPSENGTNPGAKFSTGKDVSKLSRHDFSEIDKKLARGERVSFSD